MASWNGEATQENIPLMLDFVERVLTEHGCPFEALTPVLIAVEEVVVNVVSYAYNPEVGSLQMSMNIQGGTMTMAVEDGGAPYNPLAKEDPDITLSAQDRDIGGLGVFMVKNIMDEVGYEHRGGKNVLTMVKRWESGE